MEETYPVRFLDAIHYKVKSDGHIQNKATYTCLGLDIHGYKDLLGIWIGEAESSKFWLSVLKELRNHSLKNRLIAWCDGLKGFTDAISSVFSNTIIQKCVIHQIRNSLKYIVWKDKKE